ncbi:unnamed protein product [[Candida] boidinii]|uniref:Unnamed protein product n=1 Tax=Candida boidinii TaxID=5477 RepID=A0A9W6SV34_CANBO|nr:hypothetical protein BVG19_g2183 [[Candida] boidinii]OWB50742.1 hypothetical protein B5S27_g2294 [[Candida] boidinii]OWB65307.1 hypothetical protein B5S30_g631 [[Candida] boidinii]OWB85900.1 hypothetical protein B5S33_g4575 [[Candida] boidinii]GME66876.1 unnamed protein product [[Candida] boidinii]
MSNLAPRFHNSHVYRSSTFVAGGETIKNYIQIYLDYDCPFSGKLFNRLNKEIIPELEKKGLNKNFDIVFMNVAQPWHSTSCLMHEVSLAVAKSTPEKFWQYSKILFENQSKFYDSEVINKTRNEIVNELIELAIKEGGDKDKLNELLKIETTDENNGVASNAGSKIGADFKYFTRYHRTVGIHVTPTVTINGIVNSGIESSTPLDKIIEILESQL